MTGYGRLTVLPPRGGEAFRIWGDRFVTKGQARDRPEAFSVIEYEGAPGLPGPPPHLHRGFEETWFVLEGRIEFEVQGKGFRARRGSYVHVPRGIPHTFRVPGTRPARWVGIFSPGRYVGLVEELGALIPANEPPDMRALARLFAKYDSELLPSTRSAGPGRAPPGS